MATDWREDPTQNSERGVAQARFWREMTETVTRQADPPLEDWGGDWEIARLEWEEPNGCALNDPGYLSRWPEEDDGA